MIYGDIHCQQLKLVNTHAVADTINYLEIKFRFLTDDWNGLEKWAHFLKDDLVYDIPLTDNCIREEDHLNLTSGLWTVYLHGNKFCRQNLRLGTHPCLPHNIHSRQRKNWKTRIHPLSK